MSDIDLDEFDPPERPDFRRIGRYKTPYVLNPEGKRVRYARSSNAGKILDDDSNLTDWKLRTVVAGAAQRPELMAAASVLDVDTDKRDLREIVEQCLVAGKGQRRAIIGTAVHAMFDHVDRNEDWDPPPQFRDLVDAYVATLEIWGLIPVAIEVQCVNDEFHLAGTCDRHYRTTKSLIAPDGQVIPIGSVIVADTKTGKELEYAAGSYATQLAAYVDSKRYDVVNDERIPWDTEPVKDWALIIHANSADTRVDVYWVDIRAGRLGLSLAREVNAWRKRDDLITLGQRFRVVEPPSTPDEGVTAGTVTPGSSGAGDVPASSAPDVPPDVPTLPQDERRRVSRHEYLRERVRALVGHSDVAAHALQRAWPPGVPGLKQDGHTWDQLDDVYSAVLKVEKDHSVPFFPEWDDPNIEISKANHPSVSDRWARPATVNDRTSSEAVASRLALQEMMASHPRSALLQKWISIAMAGEVDPSIDTTALAHALYEFARVDEKEWPDDDITTMLDGSLRALGYANGMQSLGTFNPEHAPLLMSAAFAIVAGNATLLIDDDGKPEVIIDVQTGHL